MAFLHRHDRHDRHDPAHDEPVELAALADGSLDPARRSALRERVAASPELAERLAVQERAVALARAAAADVEAPPALRAQVEARRRGRRRPAAGRASLAAAVAVAVAVVIAVSLVTRPGTSPDRLVAALAPTAPAAAASGHATLTKTASGWRIELRAPGLPRRAGGRFYEAWLAKPGGALVPVGSFNDGRRVTLWAGVSPKVFTTLTVTRERADGDQAPSGATVLTGAVAAAG
jgi:Anti-sigma-K factor rskA